MDEAAWLSFTIAYLSRVHRRLPSVAHTRPRRLRERDGGLVAALASALIRGLTSRDAGEAAVAAASGAAWVHTDHGGGGNDSADGGHGGDDDDDDDGARGSAAGAGLLPRLLMSRALTPQHVARLRDTCQRCGHSGGMVALALRDLALGGGSDANAGDGAGAPPVPVPVSKSLAAVVDAAVAASQSGRWYHAAALLSALFATVEARGAAGSATVGTQAVTGPSQQPLTLHVAAVELLAEAARGVGGTAGDGGGGCASEVVTRLVTTAVGVLVRAVGAVRACTVLLACPTMVAVLEEVPGTVARNSLEYLVEAAHLCARCVATDCHTCGPWVPCSSACVCG